MSSQPVDRLHPVADFAHRLVSKLDSLAEVALWSMTAEEKRDALVTLAQGLAQGEALRLRLLAEAEQSEATVDSGAGSARRTGSRSRPGKYAATPAPTSGWPRSSSTTTSSPPAWPPGA